MVSEALMNDLVKTRDQLTNVINALNDARFHAMSKQEILTLCEDKEKVIQTPIWIEQDDGQVWAAVLDRVEGHVYAVYGIDLAYDLDDYGTNWIAWNQNPLTARSSRLSYDARRMLFDVLKGGLTECP